jgi:hypothetical protein
VIVKFKAVVPWLVAAYENGKLVPFIGAGMSRPACADWLGLVKNLEDAAGLDSDSTEAAPSELIRRSNDCVRYLKAKQSSEFAEVLLAALRSPDWEKGIPKQTEALAQLWWPLVLSTNYDDYYVAAFKQRWQKDLFDVLGRSPADCQRVLSSLSTAGRSLLWALQGYLDCPRRVNSDQACRFNSGQGL